ncbi:hypothetical protein SEUCBS139899_002225, partial [Sporothrix eucalyptigena]
MAIASNATSKVDMLIIMPPSIEQEAKYMLNFCGRMPNIDESTWQVYEKHLELVLVHDATQARFQAARNQLKQIVAEAKSFNAEEKGIAGSLTFMSESRQKYSAELKHCAFVLDELLEQVDEISSVLNKLSGLTNVPPASQANRYFARQHIVYSTFKQHFHKYRKNLNSNGLFRVPGEEFGLVPFQDIVLSEDGQLMIWNDEIDDWDLPEDIHPCRHVPGSNWGKFFFDLTPSEFYMKEKRPQIDWTHASPARRLLESLQTTHFLANSGTADGSGSTIEAKQGIWAKNLRIAAATGLRYPIYDNENLE